MNLNKTLRYISIFCLFVIPFIPLLVVSSFFFPYITGKNVAFRALVEIAFACWAVLALRDKKYRPTFSWLTALYAAFVVILFIADIHGVDPHRSFFSNFERMEGWVTHLHLFLYFITAAMVLSAQNLWERFMQTNLVVSVIVAMYGFAQLATTARIDATLGNADYLAVYMLFNIFFALFLIARAWKRTAMNITYGIIILLDVIALYFTATRGVILGLGVGLFISALLIALFGKAHQKLRKTSAVVIAVIVLGTLGFLAVRHTNFVKNNPVLGRFASISISDATTRSRFYIWNMAYQGFKEKPIIGWGQENFNYVFASKYDPRMYDQEPWFDRTHNVFLDWLIAGGILGLLLYLSLFGAVVYYIWQRKSENPFSLLDKSILSGLLAGYFFQNLFVFDNIVSYMFFFGLLAYVVASYRNAKNLEGGKVIGDGMVITASVVIVIALGFGMFFTVIRPVMATTYLIDAMSPQSSLQTNLDDFGKALGSGPTGGSEIREQFLQIALQVSSFASVPDDMKQSFLTASAAEIEKQLAATPNDVRELLFYGSFLNQAGAPDRALPVLQKAHTISPNKQDVSFNLGTSYILLQQYDAAYTLLKATYESEPNNPDTITYYATAATYDGKTDVLLSLYGTDTPANTKVAQAYLGIGNYAKAITVANKLIAANPNDVTNHLLLAGIYLKEGNKSGAIKELTLVISLDASYQAQIQPVIDQLEGKTAATTE